MSVSPEDIESVRQAQVQMMPEAITISKRVQVPDGRGGTRTTYTALPDPLPGRVGKVLDRTRQAYASQLRGNATAMLTVPVGSPLEEGDRVHVFGTTYNIVADMSRASFATAARYLIEETP